MEEIWKPVPGYEGYYEISNTGKVRSLTRTITDSLGKTRIYPGKILTQKNVKGYYKLQLSKDGTRKEYFVHRLLAEAFIPNPDNLPAVNHKDENKQNNNIDNLEWCTVEYNNRYGTKNERCSQTKSKPVIMCDKNTQKPIKEFPSVKIAADELGISQSSAGNIYKILDNPNKTAYGYIWKRKNIDNA